MGSLDKELIRRVVRQHMNEVRFCYESGLLRDADLFGRVQVSFTIGANGQVVAAAVQSSTLNGGKGAVEQCIAGAARRWSFPRPERGIVMVTYPFSLHQAGAN